MYGILVGLVSAILGLSPAQATEATDGLVRVESNGSVEETARRLEALLGDRGLQVFARVDHTEGARGVGLDLRPTQLLIFGNPKVGTPLMQCNQSAAIDLPQKALVWEDAAGQVWIGYNDPDYLKTRHNLVGCEAPLERVKQALRAITAEAAQN